ncbi:hypothetical protein J1N35_001970 [Gossypium stocksii]|uniref:Uncharacterized protein n=1 Tax=Gossypium stocksii TaxID=47602 RepID=A0A9D4ALX1_9ROSI|nr:hypothetical protein J1N35_001970 [Gossypium stocksii]
MHSRCKNENEFVFPVSMDRDVLYFVFFYLFVARFYLDSNALRMLLSLTTLHKRARTGMHERLGLPLEYWLHWNGKKLPVVPHFSLSPLCVRLS